MQPKKQTHLQRHTTEHHCEHDCKSARPSRLCCPRPLWQSLTARLKVFLVFPFRLSLNYPFGISEAVGPGHPKKRRPKPGVPRCLFFIEKTASRGHLQNSRSENLAAKLALRAKAKRKKESENQRERGRVPVHACLM